MYIELKYKSRSILIDFKAGNEKDIKLYLKIECLASNVSHRIAKLASIRYRPFAGTFDRVHTVSGRLRRWFQAEWLIVQMHVRTNERKNGLCILYSNALFVWFINNDLTQTIKNIFKIKTNYVKVCHWHSNKDNF